MRYRFIDRVLSLEAGPAPRIEVSKTFEPGDDAFSGPAGAQRVPNSLVLELLVMTGGYLIFRHLGAVDLPLLLKVQECRFAAAARPGVPLRAAAELAGVSDSGSPVMAEARCEVHAGEERVAQARLFYVCVSVSPAALIRYEAGW